MARRLTAFSKLLITLIIVGLIVLGGKYILDNTEFGRKLQDKNNVENTTDETSGNINTAPKSSSSSSSDDGNTLKVQVFTWGGYAPGIYFNEGFEANEHSRFYKEYGFKVAFILQDDFNASRQMWRTDKVHMIGSTADALPTEMEGLGQFNPQIVMQVDWSRGGDAIIASRKVKTVNDLRGKRVAYTPTTPSQTFLIKTLDAAGLKLSDIKAQEMPDNIKAAAAFKAGKVDAAVVWSPDDEIAVREVPGSRVLQSTREASHIIADVFVAKKDFVDKNKKMIQQFYEGWMRAAAEINANASNKNKAARLLALGLGLPTEDAMGAMANVHLCTHGDNLNFFGLNPRYKGVTGDELYSQMGDRFEKINMAPADRPDWRRTAYKAAASATDLTGPTHNAEGEKDYAPPTKADEKVPAFARKPVSINFATAEYKLSENAKTIIDLQFSDVAKSFGNTRVRIEGNTDNVGNYKMNKELSLKRAQSVKKYLQDAYSINPNRFVIVGNGPDKPVKGCETNATKDCKAKNRRTEFQLLAN